MSSSYSNNLKIQLMGNGEDSGTWGTITNTNWNLIEQSVAGVQTITMANANYTLSNLNGVSDEARNMVLNIVGTNSGIYQVVAPLVSKFYIISNNTSGGYAITIGASTGSIITVPNGTTAQVYCDGTNFYSAQTTSAGNFLVNGNFSCTGNQVDVGNLTIGGTLGVAGAVTLSSTSTAPTPTTGDSSTNIATTAFVQTAITNYFPSGTRLVFAQAAAPTGWTQDVSDTANNRMMCVIKTAGGGVGGSYDPTVMSVVPYHTHGFTTGTESNGHIHEVAGGTSSVDINHYHNVAGNTGTESVYHQHLYNPSGYVSNGQGGGGDPSQKLSNQQTANTGNQNQLHVHSFNVNSGYMNANNVHSHSFDVNSYGEQSTHTHSGGTDGGSSQTNWTPRYNNVIICQKN